jgi:Tol biopolymer transport system component
MRQWLTLITISIALAQASWAQLTIRWISQGANLSGQPADSRFPSISADGTRVVFQVGNGATAQIWQSVFNTATNQWQSAPVTIPGTTTPLLGTHPVISADGNHIAFASWQDYRPLAPTNPPFPDPPKSHIYVLDRLQNRIVPISFLWQDTNNDGVRDTFLPCLGNCIPVSISADGRIVVFLAQFPQAQNIVDADGNGIADTVSNLPTGWLVLIHDRDADGNGIYDEAGIGATRTFVASVDNNGNYLVASAVSVSANGRTIAFATPDTNNPDNWHLFIRDWQSGTGDFVRDSNNNPVLAFAPVLSDDGTYLAYLSPANPLNEQTTPPYFRTTMDLVMRQLIDPTTGQPPAQIRELRLSGLQLPPQAGAADGSVGYGYNDWWGAVTLAVDPRNSNFVYAAFHAWSTELIDFQQVRNDLTIDPNAQASPLRFYQGVPNIFLARFDFTNIDTNPQAPQLWRLTEWTDQQQMNKRRGLPVSLEPVVGPQTQYRLTLAPSLLPAVSFVNGNRLAIAFQSLVAFDANDTNGLWDIYLANVLLP